MPDGKTWFAQNLNYTKDLTFNAYAYEANGKPYVSVPNGVAAIGSYWCPAAPGSTSSEGQNTCNTLGALYSWETAMMVDGKYADESKTSSAWDESWVSPNYYPMGSLIADTPNADRNNARGGTTVKGGGRGICPLGWHIPTAREWAQMLDKVDGDGQNNVFMSTNGTEMQGVDAGIKLKTSGTYTVTPIPWNGAWYNHAQRGTDLYQFAVYKTPMIDARVGTYYRGYASAYATACPTTGTTVYETSFFYDRAGASVYNSSRAHGRPQRCIKD
jgi:uncharacterized protein (TIGR02145 family)